MKDKLTEMLKILLISKLVCFMSSEKEESPIVGGI